MRQVYFQVLNSRTTYQEDNVPGVESSGRERGPRAGGVAQSALRQDEPGAGQGRLQGRQQGHRPRGGLRGGVEHVPDHAPGVHGAVAGDRDPQAGAPSQHHPVPRLLVPELRVCLYHRTDDQWDAQRVSSSNAGIYPLTRYLPSN